MFSNHPIQDAQPISPMSPINPPLSINNSTSSRSLPISTNLSLGISKNNSTNQLSLSSSHYLDFINHSYLSLQHDILGVTFQ